MTTLRTSVQDYLAMRRGLGFKLRDAGVVARFCFVYGAQARLAHHHRSCSRVGAETQIYSSCGLG